MTELTEIILRRIRATGPISVADYMAECLLHPKHGYYTTREPFGEAGDFTTAPEISQMFGELLGLCIVQTWLENGRPEQITLAELGPGRGTLMADILRAARLVPEFLEAAQVVLMEASPALRRKQQEMLPDADPVWIEKIDQLPEQPLFLIANEFFDALPIRQFSRDGAGWREHLVTEKDGKLALGLSAPAPLAILDHRLADTKPGDTVEIRPMATPIMQTIANRLATHGGGAIFIDYGDWRSLGDTFQAVKDHKPVSPLAEPGQADLTAHVDFEALVADLQNVTLSPMVAQRDLLNALGIQERAEQLAGHLEGEELELHQDALRRLTHPMEMGTLFKAIALGHKDGQLAPGFNHDT